MICTIWFFNKLKHFHSLTLNSIIQLNYFISKKFSGTDYFLLVYFTLPCTWLSIPVLHFFIFLPNSNRYSTEFVNQLQVLSQGSITEAQKYKIILLGFLFSPKKVHLLSEIQAGRVFLRCPCIHGLRGEFLWMVRVWTKWGWKSCLQTPQNNWVGWACKAQEQGTTGMLFMQS